MTSLSTIDPGRPLALRDAADPPMSRGLAYHVRGGSLIPAGPGEKAHFSPAQGYPTADEIAEAARLVAGTEAAFRPATPAAILAWVSKLRTLPGGPKDDAAAKAAVGLIVLACGDLPALCWTQDTLALAARSLEWFPQPKKLDDLLRPIAKAAEARRAGLQRIADTVPMQAVERGPYPVQPVPDWCKAGAPNASRHFGAPEPGEIDPAATMRSRDEQLAALGFRVGDDGKLTQRSA